MPHAIVFDWRSDLLLSREVRTSSARSELARRAAGGDLVRIARGAYLNASTWNRLDASDRFRMAVRAVALAANEDLVLSHASAAAIWGLPWFGHWPDRVDALQSRSYGGHSTGAVKRHVANGSEEYVEIDGLRVTSLARTVVDIARSPGFTRAVVVGDAALNPQVRSRLAVRDSRLDRDALLTELTGSRTAYAASRALDVIGFLDGDSESAGESISRATMARAGLPAPILQHPFRRAGGTWRVDFWWPDHEVIGEFDGAYKYLDGGARSGRSPEQIVYAEKLREDELRRRVAGFARWDYTVACSPNRLVARLAQAGVRPLKKRRIGTDSTS